MNDNIRKMFTEEQIKNIINRGIESGEISNNKYFMQLYLEDEDENIYYASGICKVEEINEYTLGVLRDDFSLHYLKYTEINNVPSIYVDDVQISISTITLFIFDLLSGKVIKELDV